MKKLVLIPIFVIVAQVASAGCCFINESTKCTFWDLDNWESQETFCSFFSQFSMSTSWDSKSCSELTIPTTCVNGWNSGDSQVKEAMQQLKNSNSGGGGGGCSTNWKCSPWSACENGLTTRTCNDLKHCGYKSPVTSQKCTSNSTITQDVVNDTAVNESNTTDVTTTSENLTAANAEPTQQPIIAKSHNYYIIGAGAALAGLLITLGFFLLRH